MINALFVCGKNRLRSPTAEHVFARWAGVETDSAGLSADAETQLSAEQIDWADIVFVMEKAQLAKLRTRFRPHLSSKRIVCLEIPDDFAFMQAELVALLETRAGRYLRG